MNIAGRHELDRQAVAVNSPFAVTYLRMRNRPTMGRALEENRVSGSGPRISLPFATPTGSGLRQGKR